MWNRARQKYNFSFTQCIWQAGKEWSVEKNKFCIFIACIAKGENKQKENKLIKCREWRQIMVLCSLTWCLWWQKWVKLYLNARTRKFAWKNASDKKVKALTLNCAFMTSTSKKWEPVRPQKSFHRGKSRFHTFYHKNRLDDNSKAYKKISLEFFTESLITSIRSHHWPIRTSILCQQNDKKTLTELHVSCISRENQFVSTEIQ